MTDPKRHSIVLAALEAGEAIVDFLATNEAVKAVPVLSTAVRMLEGADDFRTRLLQGKLKRFFSDPSLLRSVEALKLRSGILENSASMASVGDTLFMVIDKVTDSEKPALLAKVYAHLLDGGITADDFLLLAHTIDTWNHLRREQWRKTIDRVPRWHKQPWILRWPCCCAKRANPYS